MRALLLIAVLLLPAGPSLAVQPDEIMDDPVLEARARDISEDVRCLVCRSENIDASNSGWARDVRLVIRERLAMGDTDAEVKQFLVDRFGEYVLFNPTFTGANLALWLAGPVLLVLGGGAAFGYLWSRRRAPAPAERPLDAEEEAALARALADDPRHP